MRYIHLVLLQARFWFPIIVSIKNSSCVYADANDNGLNCCCFKTRRLFNSYHVLFDEGAVYFIWMKVVSCGTMHAIGLLVLAT